MDHKNITGSNYKVITYLRVLTVFSLILLGSTLSGCSSSPGSAESTPHPVDQQKFAALIAAADQSFAKRDDLASVREGIESLKKARQEDRRSYEAAWKLSRMYFYLGKYSANDDESQTALKEGIDAGRIATRVEQEKAEGYFWLGANLGENARRNPLTGVATLGEIRETMEKVISIDAAYEGASAYDVLAQIELETDLFGGSAQKASEYLDKAIALEKNNSNLYLHLAEAYLVLKQPTEAKKFLDKVINMPVPTGHEFEHRETVEHAKQILKNRF